jgi:hypothetical protein
MVKQAAAALAAKIAQRIVVTFLPAAAGRHILA